MSSPLPEAADLDKGDTWIKIIESTRGFVVVCKDTAGTKVELSKFYRVSVPSGV